MADLSVARASPCKAYELGVVDYGRAFQLQNSLVASRVAGNVTDLILLLQHPPALTIGVSGSEKDIIVPRDLLDREGIRVFSTDRGGNITYHGPGQLVGYIIADLKAKGMGIHQYVHDVEEVVIRTLETYGISAGREPKYPGVWVGSNKICALGIRVSHWVTKHGFALNVNTDLRHFGYITPCGITDRGVTSMGKLLGREVDLADVAEIVLAQCGEVFGMDIEKQSAEQLGDFSIR